MIRIAPVAFMLILSTSSLAEIYRWVDNQGKVHFSDKKPTSTEPVEDISAQLQPLNSDSSASETAKLQQVFQGETPEEQAYREQQQAQQQQQEDLREQGCKKARHQLSILRGRVAFIGPDGKEVVITEEERARRADELDRQIRQHCS
ncbi:MAG: DUF4124 domain-containing protein [Porticoccaceae bacterium]